MVLSQGPIPINDRGISAIKYIDQYVLNGIRNFKRAIVKVQSYCTDFYFFAVENMQVKLVFLYTAIRNLAFDGV